MRQTLRTLAGRGQPRWKLVEPVNARDLLDEIDFPLNVRAPGRQRALPRGQQRTFRAAIVVHPNRSESQRAERPFNLLVRYVGTHDAQNLRAREAHLLREAS